MNLNRDSAQTGLKYLIGSLDFVQVWAFFKNKGDREVAWLCEQNTVLSIQSIPVSAMRPTGRH